VSEARSNFRNFVENTEVTEDRRTKIQLILFAISLLISCLIISYFWFIHRDFTRKIEIWVMILAVVYIAIELVKKNLLQFVSRWNRLYYIGLLGIIAPVALENKAGPETLRWITNIGVLFLLAPLVVEAGTLFKAKQT
jgi:hypothetical protein